jgi:uncharacterized delta-60 repeat protein
MLQALRGTIRLFWPGLLACAAALLAVLGMAGVASAAAPGTLDSSFGSAGVAAAPSNTRFLATAVQSDGKVVAVGESGVSGAANLMLARFTASGALDPTFGSGGVVEGPAVGSFGSLGRAVTIQSDGKIVVVGKATNSDATARDGLLIERYNSNGRLDGGFGSSGVVNVASASFGDGYAVAIQPNGKIIATGSIDAAGSDGIFPRVAVVRLNPNGGLDSGFAGGGVDVIDLGAFSYALGVALQSDGKIVIGGSQSPGLQVVNALIARLTSSGSLDSSFAAGGAYAHQYAQGAASSSFNALAIQGDGKIVAAGAATTGNTGADAIVVRFTSGGAQDGSFGSGGVVYDNSAVNLISSPTVPGANGVVIAPNGDIVAAGVFANSIQTFGTLWALTSSGAADGAFGSNGTAMLTNTSGNNTEFGGIAISPTNGDLLAAGDSASLGGTPTGIVARYIGFGAPPSPPFSLTLSGLKHSYKTSKVAKHGLKLLVGCNQACTISVVLSVSAATARKLHLKVHGKTLKVAGVSTNLSGAGTVSITLRLSKRLASALETLSKVALTLTVTVTSTSSQQHHTIKRSVGFKR